MTARKRLIGTIGVIAAILVPVAQAERPDDRALKGIGAIELAQQSEPVRPDDRAGLHGPGAIDSVTVSTSVRPDDRAEPRGPGAIDPAVVAVERHSTGFDWGDALVGVLGGMGIALVLTGALFLVLGTRTRTRTA